MSKVNKAEEIAKLLEQGRSVKTIKKLAKASESYIYMIKKMLAEKPFTPEEVGVSEEALIEVAVAASQGRQQHREAVEADTNVDTILNERGSRYGNFFDHARITYTLKEAAHKFAVEKGKAFTPDQAEAMDMIFHKLGRILNGDPNYADSWVDIAGYAQLVADRLQGKIR